MKKVVFTGCSFTAGDGWIDTANCKNSPHLWVNLCHKNIIGLQNLELFNCAKGGASNQEIFEQATGAMSEFGDSIDTLFCQWTSGPRYNFNVGFELWDTSEGLSSDARKHDINLSSGGHWPRKYVQDLLGRLRVMHHLHWEILHVVRFSNIVKKLGYRLGIRKIIFINGLCHWDKNYFVCLTDVSPESYTPFTKKEILDIDSKDDQDIFKLYHMAHSQYLNAGGIDPQDWANLYDSFLNNKIDVNSDNRHPGILSNKIYYDLINKKSQSI